MQKIILKSFENSSVIKLSMWNPDTQDLIIVFSSGSIWRYAKVPYVVCWSLYSAESSGNYFNKNIRGKYEEFSIYKPGVPIV